MTATAPHTHRVSRAVAGVREDLAEVMDSSLWSMDAAETAATIEDLGRAEAQLAELKTRLLLHAEAVDVPGQSGATSTPNWHAHHTKLTRRETHRQIRLAHGLEQHDVTRAALAEGRVHVEQAEAILRGLADLPDDPDPDLVQQAEAHLIEQARTSTPRRCSTCPASSSRSPPPTSPTPTRPSSSNARSTRPPRPPGSRMWDDGHGKLHGRFTLDSAVTGAMLTKALHALAAPRHRASQGPLGDRLPTPERLGQAFAELIQRYPTNRLPKAGGLNATLVVLIAPRDPDGRTAGSPARHRPDHQPIHGPQARLRGRDHPRRPRR